MSDKKSFYAIIPAFVRYDSDLSSTSKLIYAEISALCNEKGYCWATNQYFSSLFNISDRQVRNILKQLCEKKYIEIIIEKNTKRKIFILHSYTPEINFHPLGNELPTTSEINFHRNNIINNKNNKNKNNTFDDEEEEMDGEFLELLDYEWFND